jgi:hypothetical protein
MVGIAGSARTANQSKLNQATNLLLRRLAIVVLQQSAQPRLAANIRHWKDIGRICFASSLWRQDQFIFQALMGSFRVIMIDRFSDQIIQVLFAEDIEVIQNLGLERLDDTLDIGYNVRGTNGGLLDLGACFREFRIEARRELTVPVMHQNLNTELGLLRESEHRRGLLLNPRIVRVVRAGRDVNSPRSDVNEYEDKYLANAQSGDDAFREEVALPECGGVNLDELVPRTHAPFGTWVESVFTQDVSNGASANNTDTQFLQLAQNACEAPSVFAGHFEDQTTDVNPGSRPAFLPSIHRRSPALTNPATERVRMDDGDQLIQGFTQFGTKSNEPISFVRSQSDPRGQFVSQDPVLNLQVADMPGEIFVGRGRKNQQESSIDVAHRGNLIKCSRGNRLASFLHTARTPSTWTKHHSMPTASPCYDLAG